jgi:hypothetical protein
VSRNWLRRPKEIAERPGWPDAAPSHESEEWVRSRFSQRERAKLYPAPVRALRPEAAEPPSELE